MIRAFRYPLHPTPEQAETFTRWLGTCCDLYNAALQERRAAYPRGVRVTYFGQTVALTEIRAADPDLAIMPADVQRSALDRLRKAFDDFFRRCKAGDRPGYPRFRVRRRYDSFSYSVKVDHVIAGAGRSARLAVPTLGTVRVNAYRPLKGKPLQVTIRRDACGKWWACLTCDLGVAPDAREPKSAVGLDVGLSTLAALSTGELVENPRHAERVAQKLANRQRVFARRRKGSRSRERARVLVAKQYQRVANQRLDHARKVAVGLVSRFDLIAVEDLHVARMVHGNLAKSIYDAAWSTLIRCIELKAEFAGVRVIKVNPRGTSQECSACGAVVQKDLSVRTHVCACGLVLDRDVNAARNILARALAPGLGAVSEPKAKARGKARRSKRDSGVPAGTN